MPICPASHPLCRLACVGARIPRWGRRDSNPHWGRFKRPASASWATPPGTPFLTETDRIPRMALRRWSARGRGHLSLPLTRRPQHLPPSPGCVRPIGQKQIRSICSGKETGFSRQCESLARSTATVDGCRLTTSGGAFTMQLHKTMRLAGVTLSAAALALLTAEGTAAAHEQASSPDLRGTGDFGGLRGLRAPEVRRKHRDRGHHRRDDLRGAGKLCRSSGGVRR